MESLMTSSRDLRRLGLRWLAPVLVSAVCLTACGGNTSQVTAFLPDRVIAFGDESSVIDDDRGGIGSHDRNGFKYTINDRSTSGSDCRASPIIAQSVAAHYGFVFAECNPTALTPKAFTRAIAGARVEDPLTGLAAQRAAVVKLGPTDLVTVMIGGNDIIALYEQVRAGTMTGAEAVNEAKRRGISAAQTISEMLASGARALVMTVPDISLSPYASNAAKTDSNAISLLYQLSYDYNGSLRTNILPNDGRNFGLVLADNIVAAMHKTPRNFLGLPPNVVDAACTTPDPRDCVLAIAPATSTLLAGATLANYLWASDRHIGPAAHLRIGQQAVARAVNNPF
jgi:hypothetical protein